MKQIFSLIINAVLLISLAACSGAKTSSEAPDSIGDKIEVPDAEEARDAKEDGTSKVRREQLNADIRSREQRNNWFNEGKAVDRPDRDISSEVRSKLEANLPASALLVKSDKGAVKITGTVPTQAQYDKIINLSKEIKGVRSINVDATVAPATPEKN